MHDASSNPARPWFCLLLLAGLFVAAAGQSVRSADIETVSSVIENVPTVSVDLGASPPVLVTPNQKIPLRDVLAVSYEPSFTTRGKFRVTLGDGSEITGDLTAADESGESIRISAPFFQKPRQISLEGLSKIRRTGIPDPSRIDSKAIENDRLHLVKGGLVEGILLGVTPESVSFEDKKLGEITFTWDQLIGVDLAALEAVPQIPAESIRVSIEDPSGGRLSGALVTLDARQAVIENPVLGRVEVSVRQINGIQFKLGRVDYLSDRTPSEVVEGVDEDLIDSETFQLFYRWQQDQSVERTPLIIGKRRFRKGLGVHSDSKLVFDLQPGDRTFQSWIGIDATGHPPTPNPKYGSVIFRVVVDGKEHARESINWEQPARRIQVPVEGAKRLELIVEQGPGFHICDCADWGDARIIRK